MYTGWIQDVHFHDLRHTFATRLRRLGVDYEVRQALLVHEMPGMTADYSRGGPEWDQKLPGLFPWRAGMGSKVALSHGWP